MSMKKIEFSDKLLFVPFHRGGRRPGIIRELVESYHTLRELEHLIRTAVFYDDENIFGDKLTLFFESRNIWDNSFIVTLLERFFAYREKARLFDEMQVSKDETGESSENAPR